jgi:malonate-semialdehyde dehydrogenase (acetylating)/methylmalonate-semialdehyde dehydrogenase
MAVEIIPNIVDGRAVPVANTERASVFNPSQGKLIAETPLSGLAQLEEAVRAADRSYREWSKVPVSSRVKILFRYWELLQEHSESLSQLITLENGKTLEESRGDVARGMEVVEFACGMPQLLKGENLPQVARQIDGQTSREPLGVVAGITPFNFPVMVPLWMFPVAIAAGNTFILKPSEKVPHCANRLAELFNEAGLPPGVLNVVHGGKDIVDGVCSHPKIRAVSFVGSTAVARHVYQLGTSHGKRVQAAGGAKNVMIVMPDADVDSTSRAIIGSAFGCAGQRCMAGSIMMEVGGPIVQDRLVEYMNALQLDDTSRNPHAGMGPVIDRASQKRLLNVLDTLESEVRLVRDGRKQLPREGFFVGPSLIGNVTPASRLFHTELFGPALCSAYPRSLEEALDWQSRIPYGNGGTIFTQSGSVAREFVRQSKCGMVGINVGIPAPMAMFAFSGWDDSFFGDLHVQGMEGVLFYTRQKVVLARWDNDYVRSKGW